MAKERKGDVTFKGNPLTLIGPKLKAGDAAPDFRCLKGDLSEAKLSDFRGKVKLVSVVPSLDTPVCDAQTRRFNEEAAKLGGKVAVLTVSMDLPFAQNRFCSTAGIKNLTSLSDHREASFGEAYGVLIKELRLLTRSIFLIDANDKIRYVEYVPEVTSHPNYEAALKAANDAAGQAVPLTA